MVTGFSYFSYCFTFFARNCVTNVLFQNVGFSSFKLDLGHAFTTTEDSVCECFCPCSALNQVKSHFFCLLQVILNRASANRSFKQFCVNFFLKFWKKLSRKGQFFLIKTNTLNLEGPKMT